MAELGKDRSTEKDTETLDVFTRGLEKGAVIPVERSVFRRFLSESGADFDKSSEELEPLSLYTNKAKRPGLDAVWGRQRVDEFWEFIDEFIEKHEKESGKELPKLKGSGHKFSGMRQFFGELTAFAADQMALEDFLSYTGARAANGKAWEEDRRDERVRVRVPTKDEPILLSSFPTLFPRAALEKIRSWKE